MKNANLTRERLRPHGMVAAGCRDCKFFETCRGIEPDLSLMNCFDLHCCRKPDECEFHCSNNNSYTEQYREIGSSYGFEDLKSIRQDRMLRLPLYVPVIQHASARRQNLDCGAVVINTSDVLKMKEGRLQPRASDGRDLRKKWKLAPKTPVILCGTGDDPPLEKYYAHRRLDHVPEAIAGLGISIAIGPNFSHVLDAVRTDNMFNRRRQLKCLEELSVAGISAVPHLNHAQHGDWEFWAGYLKYNSSIAYVAKEFQTGNKNRVEGESSLSQIRTLQEKIGRPLHPILIGGAQFTEVASSLFESFTILDSTPFTKARMRQLLCIHGSKLKSWPQKPFDDPIDLLLASNIKEYAKWIATRVQVERSRRNHSAAAAV